jgi:hypothetical protein
MPAKLERQAEGYAKHLGYKTGSKSFNRAKYGTMRAKGWVPGKDKKGLGKRGR